jgi:hypothetical protein
MNSKRSVVASAIIGLLVINLVALAWRPHVAEAGLVTGDVEYADISSTVHDRGGASLMVDVKAETAGMRNALTESAKKGWRVKGYAINVVGNATEHYFIMERPLR